MPVFYAGTSNIELLERNKQAFPAEFRSASRLTYYSSLFNSVEINSTFYKLPRPSTLARWVREVPDGFRFTLKVWREITHAPDLRFTNAQVRDFMRVADHIADKKAALLIQFPAGTRNFPTGVRNTQTGQLNRLLEEIRKGDPGKRWSIAVEFRHKSWYDSEVYDLLDKYDAALVWHDRPVMDEHKAHERGSFVYLRFHGPNGDYRGSYDPSFLKDQARKIRAWLGAGKNVFAYFNNTMVGDAPKDLLILNKFMQENSRFPTADPISHK